jgi:hypothetical protein
VAETLAGLPSTETSTWSAHGIRLIAAGSPAPTEATAAHPSAVNDVRHVDRGQEFNAGDGVTLTGPGVGDEDANIGNSER